MPPEQGVPLGGVSSGYYSDRWFNLEDMIGSLERRIEKIKSELSKESPNSKATVQRLVKDLKIFTDTMNRKLGIE